MHVTDKVQEGLMRLFFGLVFSVFSPEKFSADALAPVFRSNSTLISQNKIHKFCNAFIFR